MSDTTRTKDTRTMPRFRPATDIIERTDGFHIYLDMPGVEKEALVIDLNDNELAVSGKTATAVDACCKDERQVHMEFRGGEYSRTFTLSDTVDRDQISAQLTNGVLELHLPKSEKMLPKRIEITAG